MIPELDAVGYPLYQITYDSETSGEGCGLLIASEVGVTPGNDAILAMIAALAAQDGISNVTAYAATETTTSIYPS